MASSGVLSTCYKELVAQNGSLGPQEVLCQALLVVSPVQLDWMRGRWAPLVIIHHQETSSGLIWSCAKTQRQSLETIGT